MLALFAGSYNKEDFGYIIAVLAEFERTNPCLNSCEVCKHRRACADVQRLLKYARSKLKEEFV